MAADGLLEREAKVVYLFFFVKKRGHSREGSGSWRKEKRVLITAGLLKKKKKKTSGTRFKKRLGTDQVMEVEIVGEKEEKQKSKGEDKESG